jgi:hypothetical protein
MRNATIKLALTFLALASVVAFAARPTSAHSDEISVTNRGAS